MDEADGIFDKHIDFAALLKSAQSAIAAAQQQQHRRSGGITPQDSDSPPAAFASPTPSVSVGPESDISTLAKNLSHGHNNNGNGELSDVALLQQNQIISALKQQSLISPITQLALNSLSPFVPMQPVYAPSGYGRQILIYDSRSHPGRRREFAYKTRFTNQSGFTTVYYRCMACRALRHRLQRMLPKEDLPAVPCIAVKNDMLINDPDFPEASNHFCTPLTIEQSNERLKATFERGYKRARMKQAAEQEDNQTGAAIKRLAKPDSIGNDASAASRATAPFSFSPLLWTAAAAANTSESAVCAEDPFKTTDTFSLRFPKIETTDDACTSTATTAMTSGSTLNTSITTSVDELNNGICRPAAETPTSSGSPRRRLDQLLRIRQQQIIQQQQQLQQQQHQHHIKIERDKSTSPDENFNVSIFAQKLLDNSASRSPPDFLSQLNSTFANANRSVNGASSLSGKSTPSVNGAMAAAGLGNGGIEATTFGEIGGMMISSLVNNLTQLGNGSHVAGQALAQLSGADTVTNNVAADASLFNNIQQAFAAQLRNGSAELLKALNNNNTNNNNHNNFNNYFNNNNNNNVFSAASLNPNFVLDFMSNNNNNVLVKNNNNIDKNAASSPYNNNSGNNINNNGEVLSLSPNEQLSDFLQKYVKNNWDLPENAGNSRSAAELTCTLILALARHVPQAAASMKQGKWARKDYMGEEVHGKTLAIIGLGRIGQEVASRMQAFGMKIVGFDPLVSVEEAAKRKIKWLPLEEIWPIADYITVHVPLIAQTRNLLSRETFAKCKRGARIVNVARGGIVSEEDLYEALNNGQIAGAALDVFCEEPPTHHSLINHPKVVSTPHIGASTLEAQQRVAVEIAENIVALNAGTGLNGALNGAALAAVLDPSKAQYVRAVSQLTQVLAALKPATKNVVVQFPSSADGLQKAFTAAATVGLLKASEVVGLNLVNAEVNAAKEGITVTVDQADAQSTELTVFDAHSGTSVAGYASPGGTMITAINGARAPFAVLAAGNLAIAKKPNEDLRAITHNDEKLISKVTVEFSLLGGGCLALFNNNLSDEEVHRLAEHYTLVQFEDGNNNTGIDRNAEPAN